MINASDFSFLSSDGHSQIYCRMWKGNEEIRAVIQIVHGVAEHIGRYEEFACMLAEQGFAVVGDDHLGHGKTAQKESDLGWFAETDGWHIIVEDEKKLHDLISEQFPGKPIILFGHSMGSFMSQTYLGLYPSDYNACILAGTGRTPKEACQTGMLIAKAESRRYGSKYRSKRLQKIAFGTYLKGIKNPQGPNDWISRDKNVLTRYYNDPLCGFTASVGLMYDMLSGLLLIGDKRHLAKINKKLPILFVSGEADPVGGWGKGVRKVEADFRTVGMQDVTAKYYPGMRHEVLNEIGKEQVWKDILDWIETKL